MTKYVVTALAVVVVWYVASFGFRQYTSSPEYSLWKVVEAIGRHDLDTFRLYVDTDMLLASLTDEIIEESLKEYRPDTELEEMGVKIGRVFLKPQIVDAGNKMVEEFVLTGKVRIDRLEQKDTGPRSISLSDVWNKSGGDKNFFKDVAYVKKDGDTAHMGLNFLNSKYKTSFVLDIVMTKKEGYWRITKLGNATDIYRKFKKLDENSKPGNKEKRQKQKSG